ncbi:MAG: methylmalonyl Co-A mutase-associated GTPase MeaB [Chloroflexi bacterium]|nr:methylmalonyl Co-A mutase-associated GTPase MeaB [Chloroflexota bacterium]
MELTERILKADRRALARAISLVENDGEQAQKLLQEVYPHAGQAHIIGITGPPGSGKSTLVSQIARQYRQQGRTVGIVAVDPSSPFTGGALLGDRVRMRDLAGDRGVFVRSMASRGSMGGLARATGDAVTLLDAAGFDLVLIETVGAGQVEVDIAREAHTTLVVEVPGLGDEVQAIKAGLMEIADVFVVNKADHAGVDQTVRALTIMLDMNSAACSWTPPVIKTIALHGEGVADLIEAVDDHWAYLVRENALQDQQRIHAQNRLTRVMRRRLFDELLAKIGPERFEETVMQVATHKIDPYSAAARLMNSKTQGS